MCRLLISSVEFLRDAGMEYLSKQLRFLEASFGGHGNGYALVSFSNGPVEYGKGIHLKTDDIVKKVEHAVQAETFDFFVFHTRLRSAGAMNDAMCQPFIGNNAVLAHNGTVGFLSNHPELSDSHILHHLVDNGMYPVSELDRVNSYVIGCEKTHKVWTPYVAMGGNSFSMVTRSQDDKHAGTYWCASNEFFKVPDGYRQLDGHSGKVWRFEQSLSGIWHRPYKTYDYDSHHDPHYGYTLYWDSIRKAKYRRYWSTEKGCMVHAYEDQATGEWVEEVGTLYGYGNQPQLYAPINYHYGEEKE